MNRIFERKNVLITGGAGFIGSNLAARLAELGSAVTLVDSLIPEYGGNLFNLNDLGGKVRLNISDVRDSYSLMALVEGMDFLFNLAGQTSHLDSMTEPNTDLEINCRAQLSILEACRKRNPKVRIVFASTRQLYGKPIYLPVDEKHPLQPVDVNGINKLAGENYHRLYHQVYGIPASILRLTNTIGPRMRIKDARQTFVGIWIRNLLEGKPIEVWGGDQLRDILYVDDAVDAILRAGISEIAAGKIYNVGNADPISLKSLAEALIKEHGKGELIVREFPDDRKKIDIGDYYTDSTLIRDELDWSCNTPLHEALEKTLAFFRNNLKHYV